MSDINALQGFLFQQANVRGQIVLLDNTYQTIIDQHPYPPMIRYLLGEALVSCLLLTGSLKLEGDISLQFQGDKRFPLLLVQCDHQLNLRAFAKYDENLSLEEYAEAFLTGKMALTINPHHHTQAYQSIVPIHSTDMSENLTHYFAQSEQITTQIWFASDETRVAGMMLQLMPDTAQNSQSRENFWEYATKVGQTITNEELLTLDNETILYRLYHETELLLFDSRSARFRCHCSRDKMQQVIKMLGEQDARDLLAEKGTIEVSCDFCNNHYNFDEIDVTLLFTQK
jgi:molecular chaperone Hsp33